MNDDLKKKLAAMAENKTETGEQAKVAEASSTPDKEVKDVKLVEKLYHVFYNTIPSCKTITESGRTISFVCGKYITDVQEDIDFLQKEIKLGNIHIFIKEGEEQLTSDELDPMKMLKKKHVAEYLAEQKELADNIKAGTLPESESDTQKLAPGSTDDIASLSEGSGS